MTLAPPPNIVAPLDLLRDWLRSFDSAVVAYSGGVDSALVLAVAAQVLGDRAVGCIGVSPSYPQRELTAAIEAARQFGATVRIVHTHEHENPSYAANPTNRCYFCKSELYDRLTELAAAENFAVILDGTHAGDLAPGQHRPGYAAARERGIRSPLAELGLNKPQVRAAARQMNLGVWDKPAAPCLASRVPTGTAIVPALLQQIEAAEDVLARLGFKDFRVRHHGEVARIELPAADLPRAIEQREALLAGIRSAGYRFVTLDLAGFRSGSLSVLSAEKI
jgi:uncharacterized protein